MKTSSTATSLSAASEDPDPHLYCVYSTTYLKPHTPYRLVPEQMLNTLTSTSAAEKSCSWNPEQAAC